jgi:hypothetical protein
MIRLVGGGGRTYKYDYWQGSHNFRPSYFSVICVFESSSKLNSRTRQSLRCPFLKIISISPMQPYHLVTVTTRIAQISPYNARIRILIIIRINILFQERKSMAGLFTGVMAPIRSGLTNVKDRCQGSCANHALFNTAHSFSHSTSTLHTLTVSLSSSSALL